MRLLGLLLALTLLPTPVHADPALPPPGHWDYQISGAFPPAPGVTVVSRDRQARPVSGRYNICYLNAFQTQPHERRFWRRHWWLVLKRDGRPVLDEAWNEWLLDVGTLRKRRALLRIEQRWLAGCARKGFDAVEPDNLDSWTRSGKLLDRADNVRFARMFNRAAHRLGLAVAQKNAVSLASSRRRIGFDLAITEDCALWRECGAYVRAYGRLVFDVEYTRRGFRAACRQWGDRIAIVRRDLAVSPSGVNRRC